jgi:hypothetical protein
MGAVVAVVDRVRTYVSPSTPLRRLLLCPTRRLLLLTSPPLSLLPSHSPIMHKGPLPHPVCAFFLSSALVPGLSLPPEA